VKGRLLFFYKAGLTGAGHPLFFEKKTWLGYHSGRPTKSIKGKSYTYRSKKRVLRLTFKNDTLCLLENTFKCANIDSDVKSISIKCTYKREGDKIFLRNANCSGTTECVYDLAYPFAGQASPECSFLDQPADISTRLPVGPT